MNNDDLICSATWSTWRTFALLSATYKMHYVRKRAYGCMSICAYIHIIIYTYIFPSVYVCPFVYICLCVVCSVIIASWGVLSRIMACFEGITTSVLDAYWPVCFQVQYATIKIACV